MFSFLQRQTSDVLIRPLTVDDWDELEAMISTDPVAFLYAAEHLALFGLPSSAALPSLRASSGFIGVFENTNEPAAPIANPGLEPRGLKRSEPASLSDRATQLAESLITPFLRPKISYREHAMPAPGLDGAKHGPLPGKLVGAFWLGSNCVPLHIPEEYRPQAAAVIARSARTVASIFGSQEEVLGLWKLLAPKMGKPLSVRENQPLLCLPLERSLEELVSRSLHREQLKAPQLETGGVRWARSSDRRSLLKASVSMFIEEVGYDPMTRDPLGYARRVDEFIRTGRSLVAMNTDGIVVFKADLGLAHEDICQVQGVWLHPAYRGLDLSAPLLAHAFELIRPRFPHISLYVNDFNTRARSLYRSLGMEQADTFSTILF